MRFLETERGMLRRTLPGLDEALTSIPPGDLERPGSPGPGVFKEAGGPALLVPADLGGIGASPLDAVRVQRAIGSRSPSLAVATTMHHFSVASLVAVSETNTGMDWMLLQAIAADNLLLASGFAEGRPDGQILKPTMTATPTPDGVRLSGVKKPCSLSHSMDLLTASVMLPGEDGPEEQLAVALIPAKDDGVSISPFWSSFALGGAESDQVTIDDVLVPSDLVVRTSVGEGEQLDDIQNAAFLWFELLITGSYLGAASAVVELALGSDRISESDRLRLAVTLEGAMASVENVARRMEDGLDSRRLLVDALLVRYSVQDAIATAVPRAVELLGGLNFITSDRIGYLAAAVNGLGFHPPARAKMAGPLLSYLNGDSLTIS
ncbi:acyl-CoA dehydrogenase family protein [Prescottella agglutinans]|uniref:Alkylation response protein AidB-like acyl-CoA dehydrogenase n=1 Tax=Prescottella agglutinans TaxID=1644129 RepID=A0ABT6M9N8_9NOCA|nr:acyl-CoA dehydrogenase family protein [Prescottella agglutinans]MDH6281022.1 alkylation response protein AidB-like acyl-CoA dehydrogenase [Prescottella agglutinans]